MKEEKITKTKLEKPFHLSEKTAIIILLVLPVLYFLIFAPGLLTGSKMMYGSDWLLGGYPAREIISREISQFETMPMWYNYIFGGLPTVTGPYGDVASIYPFIRLIVPTHIFWTYLFVFGMMFAGIGMYFFLKSLSISSSAALIGSVAYMFAGNLISTTHAGHEGRLLAAAFFPIAFFFWNKAIITQKFHWFVFAGAMAGFSFLHGHFQLTYYGLWVALAYFVIQLILNRRQNSSRTNLKQIVYAIISVVITLCILSVNYLPFLGNLAYGARGEVKGYEFAASWALPPKEIFDLIIPQFSGLLDNYWGSNYFKLHTEYFGIFLLLFAGLTLFIKIKERRTLFFLGTAIIGTLMAFGGHTPFFKIVYYIIPGIKRFRGPSMVFYLVAFSIVVLGAIGLQRLFDIHQHKKTLDKNLKKKIMKFIYFVIAIFFLGVIIFLTSKSTIQDPQKLQIYMKNTSVFWRGIVISLLLTVVCIFLFMRLLHNKIKVMNFILIILVLILFDQWRIDSNFLKTVDNPNIYYASDEIINFLKNDTTLYRVYPLYYDRSNDGILDLYNIQNVGGYCPNPLQRYQDFIGAGQTVMFSAPNLVYHNFLDLLNVKYIISVPLPEDISRYDARTQAMIMELKSFVNQPGIHIVYSGRKNIIYQNDHYLPRVFLVSNYETIKSKDEIINQLKVNNFNPQQYVIISESIPELHLANQDSFSGTAMISNYEPNRIIIEAEVNHNGFLILSENYHPDWFCKVDGKITKVYPAYHTFRTVYLESGKHRIEFFYYSKLYILGRLITIITSFFCIGVAIIYFRKRKIKKHQEVNKI